MNNNILLMKILVSILIIAIISCKEQDKEKDITLDIVTGIINGAKKYGDKMANFAKARTEIFIRKTKFIGEQCAIERRLLEQSLKAPIDKAHYYSTLRKLTSSTFVQDVAESIEKSGSDAFIRLGGGFHTISKFVGDTVGKAVKVLPFVSAAYNGYESIKRVSEGDYIGATIKVAEATVSCMPGLSFGQTLLPSALSFAYDLVK